MLTQRQSHRLKRDLTLLEIDKGSVPYLRGRVQAFCKHEGICARCYARHAEPHRLNCGRCLAYKRVHKLKVKEKL